MIAPQVVSTRSGQRPRDITEVAPLVRTGAVSPVELVRECLARIAARPELNAFITVLTDSALAEARNAEREIKTGTYRGPLHGIPISVKDLIDVAGTPSTAGSKIPARPSAADAPIVTRLRAAGAVIVGKTNLHEFAFGTTSDESAFGPVRHPLDPSRSPGGSSGGAAVALVEGMCFGSIGTDTGGSIRIPSAACGTVGLKPTLGELPCNGIVPLSATLDHVGPMARSVGDVGVMFHALRGEPAAARDEASARADRRLVFGVPDGYFLDRLDPEVRLAFDGTRDLLSKAGHEIIDVHVEGVGCTADVYLHICLPEASWYHAPMLESHAADYSPGVRLRLEMGRYILAEDMARAFRLREGLTHAVDAALDRSDALLLPALPIVAPAIGAQSVEVDGYSMPTRAAMLRLTQLFNITGHPALALPNGSTADGWPTSAQLVGRRGETAALLRAASTVERYIIGGPGSVGGGTG
jgi:aspartyl-tRNA(Asn)/glutamyl-tRNA(Gln) amidotransferase subunit A